MWIPPNANWASSNTQQGIPSGKKAKSQRQQEHLRLVSTLRRGASTGWSFPGGPPCDGLKWETLWTSNLASQHFMKLQVTLLKREDPSFFHPTCLLDDGYGGWGSRRYIGPWRQEPQPRNGKAEKWGWSGSLTTSWKCHITPGLPSFRVPLGDRGKTVALFMLPLACIFLIWGWI